MINGITQVSPAIALLIFLVLIGIFLKKTPHIQDWTIPYVVFFAGMFIYPFIAEVGGLKYNVPNPFILKAIFDGIIGGASVGSHQLVKQFAKRKFGISLDDSNSDLKEIRKENINENTPKNDGSNQPPSE